jgi:2-dehydropantoate 2-reductase
VRIAVVGAGAMGGIFGAGFHSGGHETVLVDVSRPLIEKIEADGITIVSKEGSERTVRVPATGDPASVGHVDLAVFFVKCYHTASAAETARSLVGRDTVVASLQNGWGNGDVLAAAYDSGQIVVGVTYNSGTVLELGKVAHPGVGATYLGPFEGDSVEGAERLAQVLQDGGFKAHVTTPIRPEIWKKLILNAATLPTASLAGMNAGALTAHELMHGLVTDTAREAVVVARALGYDIDEQERVDTIHTLLERAGPTRGSMLQDFEAGRQTEIDVINGAVVKAGDERGIPVPLNRAFVALVKGWESMHGVGG